MLYILCTYTGFSSPLFFSSAAVCVSLRLSTGDVAPPLSSSWLPRLTVSAGAAGVPSEGDAGTLSSAASVGTGILIIRRS